jgi:hypothetical protein
MTGPVLPPTVPNPPSPFYIHTIFELSVAGNSDPRYDGGRPILQYQVGYGTNPNYPQALHTIALSGNDSVAPLAQKVQYYFWARVRNEVGWSGWSGRTTARTKGPPDPPSAPWFQNVTQTSVRVAFNASSDTGGDPLIEREIAYGLSTVLDPESIIMQGNDDPFFDLSNLSPGGTYYFWGRTRNSHLGTSAWSARSTLLLVAGAKVKVGLVWKRAVPYVRVGGVWKLAEPWTKTAGFWNKIEE